MDYKFKIGDRVFVKGMKSTASMRLDGQIGIVKSQHSHGCGIYYYKLEKDSEFGIWEYELSLAFLEEVLCFSQDEREETYGNF